MNGAVRNSENEHICKLLRQKSKVFVAYGACASMGGIPGLANLVPRDEIFERAYLTNPSIEPGNRTIPLAESSVNGHKLEIPKFYERVYKLDQVVDVDYYVPGCPPQPDQCKAAVLALVQALTGQADPPPKGAVVGASERALCDDCLREKTEKKVKRFYRPWQIIADPDKCLMEQGIFCAGMATRSGCGVRCPSSGIPCRGCYGPAPGVVDQGAKLVSAVASIIDSKDPEEIDAALATLPDFIELRQPLQHPGLDPSKGATGHDAEDQHRPDHAARGARQDRDLPRRRWRRAGHLLPDPGAARLRALRRRPAHRGAAPHRHPHLRRVPGEPPHGQRQGGGRLLRRSRSRRSPTSCATCTTRRTTSTATSPTSTPWRRRTSCSAPTPTPRPATSSGSSPRWASRSAADVINSRALAQEIQRIIGGRNTQDIWCLPGGVAKGLKKDELDADQAVGRQAVRLQPVLAAALQGPGARRTPATST